LYFFNREVHLKDYYDIVIEGSENHVRGFVEGIARCQNLDEDTVIIPEEHVGKWATLDYVKKILQLKESKVHLIVEKNLLTALIEAISSSKKPVPLKILSAKPLRAASFDFSLKAFSKSVAENIKQKVSSLPAGIEVNFSKWHEEVRPEDKGIEAYAPAHDYELHASGHVKGSPAEVIEFYERLETNELVELGLIQMEYGDPIPL
jgi:hypothetical protein